MSLRLTSQAFDWYQWKWYTLQNRRRFSLSSTSFDRVFYLDSIWQWPCHRHLCVAPRNYLDCGWKCISLRSLSDRKAQLRRLSVNLLSVSQRPKEQHTSDDQRTKAKNAYGKVRWCCPSRSIIAKDTRVCDSLTCQVCHVLIPACHWFYLDEELLLISRTEKKRCCTLISRI